MVPQFATNMKVVLCCGCCE